MKSRAIGTGSDTPVLIAGTSLAARQWEAWLLEQAPHSGSRVARSPPLLGYAQWIRSLWAGRPGSGCALLEHGQSLAAWRHAIEANSDEHPLLASDAAAVWALDADRRLRRFDVDPRALRATAAQPDFGAFLRWRQAYRQRLEDAGWIDLGGAEETLARAPFAGVENACLLDLMDPAPLQRRLFAGLLRSGGCIASRRPPQTANPSVGRVQLPNAEQELQAAAEWARRRLTGGSDLRIALVVDALPSRSREVSGALETVFAGTGLPVWSEYANPLAEDPLIGAALSGLELLAPQGGFAHLSRWLRSPFFQGLDPAGLDAAAGAETRIRSGLLAQLDFETAYRQAGLRALLRRETPQLAARLDGALDERGALRKARTPTDWASRWQRSLRRLGWPATAAGADGATVAAWERALETFTRLTPILGAVPLGTAITELNRSMQNTRSERPLPRTGLHVFADIGAVGPGYDAVWVGGLTDRKWPVPPELNPLLPRDLQIRHAMPNATPQAALEQSCAALARLRARTHCLVLSWPAQHGEERAEPSPLLGNVEPLAANALGLASETPAYASVPANLESRTDVPPPLAATRIPGGAGTLNTQARCPLRAFCESRLGARPLEPPARGLPPRLQGVVTHRALQLLAARPGAPASTGPADANSLREHVAASVERALAETFGAARRAFRQLFDLERRRLVALIRELLDAEASRPPFEIVAAEQRIDVSVGTWTVPCRIDRIDRLEDGTLAVIDYKTGTPPAVRDWLRERLLETQLPVYALHAPDAVRALVVVALQRGAVAYKGAWAVPERFPGRPAQLPAHRDWPQQVAVWRRQIGQLIGEYAAGDARLFDAELALAKGAYAPLSRVYEYVADRQHHRVGD